MAPQSISWKRESLYLDQIGKFNRAMFECPNISENPTEISIRFCFQNSYQIIES